MHIKTRFEYKENIFLQNRGHKGSHIFRVLKKYIYIVYKERTERANFHIYPKHDFIREILITYMLEKGLKVASVSEK